MLINDGPARRRFRVPLQCIVVGVDKAESLRVASLPLEVVHEGPRVVATHVDAVLKKIGRGGLTRC